MFSFTYLLTARHSMCFIVFSHCVFYHNVMFLCGVLLMVFTQGFMTTFTVLIHCNLRSSLFVYICLSCSYYYLLLLANKRVH